MEKLVDSRLVGGVIDVTTIEIADLLVGGVLKADMDRLGAIARTRSPMWARSARSTWSTSGRSKSSYRFRQRKLHRHNPQVMLMRTHAGG